VKPMLPELVKPMLLHDIGGCMSQQGRSGNRCATEIIRTSNPIHQSRVALPLRWFNGRCRLRWTLCPRSRCCCARSYSLLHCGRAWSILHVQVHKHAILSLIKLGNSAMLSSNPSYHFASSQYYNLITFIP
jgi:hypothetical protein